ncbi:cytochrome P450 2C15 [Aplysia californica]|uniref:Cytochrome P450 2C15 n=1 Tax=Aplysia californica TaxID=6500 RepID=A0ABM0JT78_APLCA|nr:cytochrome P450 2C15 [Aplysia californica]
MFWDIVQSFGLSPLVFVVLLLTLVYFFMPRSNQPVNIPPIPQRPFPFLGHFPMIAKNPRGKMEEWTAKSGNIFSIYIGNQLTVVLSGYDVMKEALVKQPDIFSDRPKLFIPSLTENGYKGILPASGETWKEQRTVTLSILRSFGMGKNSLAEKIGEEVEAYVDALKDLKSEPSNVRTLTNNCVSNVICNIIFGKRFDLGDPYFVHLLEILNEQVVLVGETAILNVYPWLRFLPGDLFKAKKLLENFNEVLSFVNDRYVVPMSKNIDENNTDSSLIAAYVQEMRKRQSSGKPTTMDDGNLTRVILNLFLAGTETTSTTIVWFYLFMIHHPDILTKVYEEIEDVVGRERAPSMLDKPKLNYLNACIMETQRLASIVPFSLQHVCTKTTTVQGYTIPEGTTVIPNLDRVLWDEKTWGDPRNYRPERFLDGDRNLKNYEEFVPFSLGRRVCLGESLAKMELFLFLAGICQRFDIQPAVKGQLPPLKGVFGITSAPEAYKVRFVER